MNHSSILDRFHNIPCSRY